MIGTLVLNGLNILVSTYHNWQVPFQVNNKDDRAQRRCSSVFITGFEEVFPDFSPNKLHV